MRRALPIVMVCCLAGCIDFDADRKLCRMQGRCGDADGGTGGGASTGVGGGNAGGGAGGTAGGAAAGGGGGSAGGAGGGGGSIDAGVDGGTDGGCAPGFHDGCGVGACRRTINMCVPDSDTTTCMPGAPVAESCNLIDDNCDGSADEGTQTCGVGECVRTAAACMGGAINLCMPGMAGTETCNGLDDDCTGVPEQGKWLKDLFAVGSRLDFAVPCMQQNFPVIGDTFIADQGNLNCMAKACGRLDSNCNAMDLPAAVTVLVNASSLAFPDAGQATLSLTMRITSPPIYVAAKATTICILNSADCSFRYDSVTASPATNTAVATIIGSSDGGFPRLVALKMQALQGTQTCGASGASPPPMCLGTNDLTVMGESNCGNLLCSNPEFDIVKSIMVSSLRSLLHAKIQDVIEKQVCEPCGTGVKACPP